MARGARSAPRPRSAASRRSLPPSPFAGQRRVPAVRSALDAGAGAAERHHLADLHRHRAQPGAGAAAVRHRGTISTRGRAARRTACRWRAIRPTSAPPTCSTPAPPATTRCFRWSPAPATACRSGPLPRPVEVQITGSILTYDIADPARRQGRAGQGAGGAIPRSAPLHPRRLCALRLHPLRRSLCGVDPVPRLGAARAAAGLPRGLSGRRAFPESAAHRRRPAVAAAHGYPVRHRRAAGRGFARLQLSPERRHHRQQRRAQAAAAAPTSPPIRRSAFRWRRPRPSSARNPSARRKALAESQRRSIPGRIISARPAVSRSANAPPASAIRARTSAPALPAEQRERRACDPKQQAVVAVRDGVLIRSPKQQAATLQINTRNEHIRFRYMHMNPSAWMPTAC